MTYAIILNKLATILSDNHVKELKIFEDQRRFKRLMRKLKISPCKWDQHLVPAILNKMNLNDMEDHKYSSHVINCFIKVKIS